VRVKAPPGRLRLRLVQFLFRLRAAVKKAILLRVKLLLGSLFAFAHEVQIDDVWHCLVSSFPRRFCGIGIAPSASRISVFGMPILEATHALVIADAIS
jgi:hypothetical protein